MKIGSEIFRAAGAALARVTVAVPCNVATWPTEPRSVAYCTYGLTGRRLSLGARAENGQRGGGGDERNEIHGTSLMHARLIRPVIGKAAANSLAPGFLLSSSMRPSVAAISLATTLLRCATGLSP